MLLLDFDTAGDKALDSGKAIKNSIDKYLFDGSKVKFRVGCSDSGGGFTGEAMTDALVTEGLAVAESHLHINCTSHNDQTSLWNAVEKVYGIGGIIKRNLPQFIHAFSDVQGFFPGGSHKMKPLMIAAWKYVHGDDAEPPPDFLKMMQEPILTRWGTAGEACQYVWVSNKYHRLVFAFEFLFVGLFVCIVYRVC